MKEGCAGGLLVLSSSEPLVERAAEVSKAPVWPSPFRVGSKALASLKEHIHHLLGSSRSQDSSWQ